MEEMGEAIKELATILFWGVVVGFIYYTLGSIMWAEGLF